MARSPDAGADQWHLQPDRGLVERHPDRRAQQDRVAGNHSTWASATWRQFDRTNLRRRFRRSGGGYELYYSVVGMLAGAASSECLNHSNAARIMAWQILIRALIWHIWWGAGAAK